MNTFPLYRPPDTCGTLPMTYFHAMARLGIEGIVLVEPTDTFVSVGYFDQSASVLDLEICKEMGLRVIRREVGGGPVLLAPGQMFYQIVLSRSSSFVPASVYDAYKTFSVPVISAYARLGVTTSFKPINDLVTAGGKKISGQGAADIEDSFCFVGAVLRSFDVSLMAKVLKVPDEKFRDKLYKTLEENVSSIEKETGYVPSVDLVAQTLQDEFSKVFGILELKTLPDEVIALAQSLSAEFESDEVVLRRTPSRSTAIKVREGVELRFGMRKAQGGLIRAETSVASDVIVELVLSGDFTLVPKSALQGVIDAVVGGKDDFQSVAHRLEDFIRQNEIDMPGVSAQDIAAAVTSSEI